MIRFEITIVGAVLVILAMGGCSASYKMSAAQLEKPSAWPYHHGDAASTGTARAGSFDGRLDLVWEEEVSGKPTGPLTMVNGFLAVPSTKSRIWFYEAANGEKVGKVKSKGPAQTGLVLADSLAFFAVAPRTNRLTCLDLGRGDEIWQRRVKDASRGSILVGDRLLIGCSTGRLTAYRVANGEVVWTFAGENEQFTVPATSAGGLVFQPGSSGILYALSPEDGTEQFRVELQGPMVGAAAGAGDLVIGTDLHGNVYGIDAATGEIRWTTEIGGPIWTTPATANGTAYVGHSKGELAALRLTDGRIMWKFQAGEVVAASAIVVGTHVVVGTLGGNLYALDAADGSIRSSRRLDGGIEFAPVSDGDYIYATTNNGRVYCLGERHETADRPDDQREDPEHQPERAGAHDHAGTGDGVPQGGDLRPKPSDVAEGS